MVKMNNEGYQYYRKAGEIASNIRRVIPSIIKEKMKILDLCEKIENLIFEKGGKPAFPCNVGINEVAAHYTSPFKDESLIPEKSIVKVDFGVEISGYIVDTSITVSFNRELDLMVKAVNEALMDAIEFIKDGVKVKEVGEVIESKIKRYGFKPIRNLTGHKIERYMLHTGKIIPNVSEINSSKIEEGEVYAIEPFATTIDGSGVVIDGSKAYIFRFQKEKCSKEVKDLIKFIKENYASLPFAFRWIKKVYPNKNLDELFEKALSQKCLISYPVLIEAKSKPVAQAEHTVIVRKNGCEILTE
ncbi:type II methionyl aminopeptidase [Candidatus Bathyarchaeota archaeon]|nr:type II methionyl aminopeptidase [Candidatus Bathyarchaeota archaeon]